MRHIRWILIFGIFIFSSIATAQPVRIKVLTYNLHHCQGTDGKLDIPRIAEVITKSGADLVALQEVDNGTRRTNHVDQAKELAKLTIMHSAFGQAMQYDAGWYGDAVLSRFEIVDTQAVPLPFKPIERHEPRVAMSVRIKLPNGQGLTMISTHLDHNGGKQNDRVDQAKKINEAFKETPLAILAGDMNAAPTNDALKILHEQWFDSTSINAEPTCPADHPKSKIDYVLFKPAEKWRVIETHVIDEEVASDHRPFLAVLELQAEK